MTVEIHSADTDGSDPVPRYLAKANITFQGKKDKEEEDENVTPLMEETEASIDRLGGSLAA